MVSVPCSFDARLPVVAADVDRPRIANQSKPFQVTVAQISTFQNRQYSSETFLDDKRPCGSQYAVPSVVTMSIGLIPLVILNGVRAHCDCQVYGVS